MSEPIDKYFKKIIKQAHQLLFIENDKNSAIDYLEKTLRDDSIDNFVVLNWLALAYLEDLRLDQAKNLYLDLDQYYQASFCELLMGNIDGSKQLLLQAKTSEVKSWGESLLGLVAGKIVRIPSFLNIRNHLEADLGYFLRAKQLVFVEKTVSLVDHLAQINLEAYKFVGRALLHNDFEHLSVQYLLKAIEILPNDAEAFYHIGQYSMKVGAFDEAKQMFNHCLLMNPSYSPAVDRIHEIDQMKKT